MEVVPAEICKAPGGKPRGPAFERRVGKLSTHQTGPRDIIVNFSSYAVRKAVCSERRKMYGIPERICVSKHHSARWRKIDSHHAARRDGKICKSLLIRYVQVLNCRARSLLALPFEHRGSLGGDAFGCHYRHRPTPTQCERKQTQVS